MFDVCRRSSPVPYSLVKGLEYDPVPRARLALTSSARCRVEVGELSFDVVPLAVCKAHPGFGVTEHTSSEPLRK